MNTQEARNAYPELVVGGVDANWNVLSARPRCDWSTCALVAFNAGPPNYPTKSRVKLRVHPATEEAFTALSTVFSHHGYLFGESAGGTVSCRKITGGTKTSLHTHGIALDINPSKNPYGSSKPDELDEPQWRQLIADVKAIRTVDGHRVFKWGGDWSNDDDMHFEPTQCTRPQLERGIDWSTVTGATQPPEEEEMTLKQGDRGNAVSRFQQALAATGANIVADGIFGPATEAAVRTYQGHANLPQTGQIDGITGALLLEWVADRVGAPTQLTPEQIQTIQNGAVAAVGKKLVG